MQQFPRVCLRRAQAAAARPQPNSNRPAEWPPNRPTHYPTLIGRVGRRSAAADETAPAQNDNNNNKGGPQTGQPIGPTGQAAKDKHKEPRRRGPRSEASTLQQACGRAAALQRRRHLWGLLQRPRATSAATPRDSSGDFPTLLRAGNGARLESRAPSARPPPRPAPRGPHTGRAPVA